MNRPIKFRAWDEDTKTMFEPPEITHWRLDEAFGMTTNRKTKGWIFLQFTGLLDKNGKEIYEGDVLQDVNVPTWKYQVLWGKYGWIMQMSTGRQTHMMRYHEDQKYEYEIIGNIYENPELLK